MQIVLIALCTCREVEVNRLGRELAARTRAGLERKIKWAATQPLDQVVGECSRLLLHKATVRERVDLVLQVNVADCAAAA